MGNTQFKFSMPPENQYAPVRHYVQPAHRKSKTNVAAIAVCSMLGGALATAGVAFALVPAISGNLELGFFGDVPEAVAAQGDVQQAEPSSGAQAQATPAVMKQSQNTGSKAALQEQKVKSPYPVHRKSADNPGEPGAPSESDAAGEPEKDGSVWVEGWTEKIVHPAVYEDIPDYESYICTECGYESIDLSDIIEHIEEHESATYLTVENGGPHVELEKEWTETIYHEGYWA